MRFLRFLDGKLEEIILVPSLVFTVGLIFVQVIMRYVFHASLTWSEELARYVFVWQTWIGASFAVKHTSHIRVEFLKHFLKKRGRLRLEWLVFVLWVGFSIFLTWKSAQITGLLFSRNQVSPAMHIPMAWAYLSVPVGCGLMTFRLFQSMFLGKITGDLIGGEEA
ncbi:MAG: hypothetical protein STSR0007_11010 [Thermovirga sp.]